MLAEKAHTNGRFHAITVRSGMRSGGEEKDQDRVSWFAPKAIAAACDGLTTSPQSAEAAEVAVMLTPVLFEPNTDIEARLRVLADYLVACRLEACDAGVRAPPGSSPALQALLQEVAQENLKRSFQTTLVAAAFTRVDSEVEARVVALGDSAFFAFSPSGELLLTSLAIGRTAPAEGIEVPGALKPGTSKPWLRFGPGDELLVRALCDAAERPKLAERLRIRPGSAGRWLVCMPLDCCRRDEATACSAEADAGSLRLGPDDLLLVPRYLTEMPIDPNYTAYRRVRFSKAIRSTAMPFPRTIDLQDKSVLTAVLPDHAYTGGWAYFRERFPQDAQFVLCTDGFYTCFRTPGELWAWLNERRDALCREETREELLAQLHRKLCERQSDDDISFVWVAAASAQETISPGAEPGQYEGDDDAC